MNFDYDSFTWSSKVRDLLAINKPSTKPLVKLHTTLSLSNKPKFHAYHFCFCLFFLL